MSQTIDYFLVPNSPWTHLGHERFAALAARAGAEVRFKPMDLAQVFPVSGGLPLGQRAPQRQAYRLMELKRFSESLDMPLTIHPAFFPVAADAATKLLVAAHMQHGVAEAMGLAGALLRAVWAEEKNIADPETLAALIKTRGLPADLLAISAQEPTAKQYQANTDEAIAVGVFGSPTYVVEGELFWGQDRLDLLARCLGVTP